MYNFAAGDTIDLRDIASATGVISFSGTDQGGALTIDDGGDVATLSVTFNGASTGWSADWANHFFLADNGIGGAYLTTDLTVIESGGGGGGGGGGNGIIDNAAELIVDADKFNRNRPDTVVRGGGSLHFEEGSIRSSTAVQIGGTPVAFTNEDNHLIAVTGRSGVIGDALATFVNNSVIEADGSLLVDAARALGIPIWSSPAAARFPSPTISTMPSAKRHVDTGWRNVEDRHLAAWQWPGSDRRQQYINRRHSGGRNLAGRQHQFVGQTGRLILNETQFIST